jgi:CubicO group peptidase (beta-lactamase class C family)
MRRSSLRTVGVTALILIIVLAGVRAVAAPQAQPALGYVAKVVCSDVFAGGATPEQAIADLPDEPIARLVRTRVDHGKRRVHASLPLVARRTAQHRDGYGCTLLPVHGSISEVAATPPDGERLRQDRASAPWPEGDAPAAGAAGTGVDTTALRVALDSAFAEPSGSGPRRTRAVVVVHDGRIVAERYADGYGPEHRFAGWSMTKSVTSALVGILVGEGTLDLGMDALRPEWSAAADPRRAVTLGHLMHMNSGLDFDESYAPRGAATRMLFNTEDAAAAAAATPLAHAPGSTWYYSSGTTNLISHVMRTALGDDAAYHALPRTRLFDAIGMHTAVMEPDASGTFVGSSFMHASARDWARFGLLYLRDGVWNGRRILPEGWVAYSTRPAPAAPLGRYGAQWWLNAGEAADSTRRPWPDLPSDIFWASGFHGQYVVVIPSRDLVVVRLGVTADDRAFSLRRMLHLVMAAFPLPAGTAP